ncbi:MAG TPA: helix-turn-helix transcriptional regulator [Ktedonobacteraceae bacterium]|nr:helix-turn-helix transcriptional regulator [Ktedonobacteraceae bacterium]
MGSEKCQPNEALRHQRLLRGWSQKKVAGMLDSSVVMVNRWECGRRKTSPFYQEKLCDLFGMTAEELGFMGGSQTTKKEEEGQTDADRENGAEQSSLPQQDNRLQEVGAPPLLSQVLAQDVMTSTCEPKGIDLDTSRRLLLQGTLGLAASAVFPGQASFLTTPSPPEIFGTETLHEFARVLNKPSTLEEHHLSVLEAQTAQLWKYRDDGILLPKELYAAVQRHFQHMIRLLDGSLLPNIRTRLLAIASKTVTLCGALLYDLGAYEQAKGHHHLAIQAAAQATQPILQAIAYAWMSFSWIYEQRFQEASNTITQGLSMLADPNEDRRTFAWLTAIAAETYAHLGKYDESCSLLEQAEASLKVESHQQHFYLHRFSSAQLGGFRGVCYRVLYNPKKPETVPLLEQARNTLEQALLDSSAFARQKHLYLADLASVYARQGEVEMACDLIRQSIDLVDQATPKHVLQRLTEIQQLLHPWKETIYVKELDGFFRKVGII